jgi:hypothetical protein
VIYLEAGRAVPDHLEIRVVFPGNVTHRYQITTVKLLEHSVEGIAGQGLAVLLPFYILNLRKLARQAKTVEERKEVEAGFKELGVKLKETIEKHAREDQLSDEDIAILLERLEGLIEYIGEGYRTTEVQEMLNKRACSKTPSRILEQPYLQRTFKKINRKGQPPALA